MSITLDEDSGVVFEIKKERDCMASPEQTTTTTKDEPAKPPPMKSSPPLSTPMKSPDSSRTVSPDQIFRCDFCKKTCKSYFTYRNHLESQHGIPKTQCATCGANFKKASLVYQHEESHLSENKIYVCVYCRRSFAHQRSLLRHMNVGSCLKSKKSEPSTSSKPVRKAVTDVKGDYPCSLCGEVLDSKRRFEAHHRKHQGPFCCLHCPASFTRSDNLNAHVASIHNEQRYKCPHCAAPLASRSNLVRHIRFCSSNNNKPNVNSNDGLYSGEEQQLQTVSSNCSPSPSAFAKNNDSHFQCEICQRTFTRKCHLALHLKNHKRLETLSNEQTVRRAFFDADFDDLFPSH